MIKKILILLLLLIAGTTGFLAARKQNPPFETLSNEEMHQKIITQRDFAIQKAVETGDFRCCIEPSCTMCYMEANEWNNFTAGTCACDDLIAQGIKPCPQCERGLCDTDEKGTCQVNSELNE